MPGSAGAPRVARGNAACGRKAPSCVCATTSAVLAISTRWGGGVCFADSHANGKHATSRAPRQFDPVRIPWHHGVPGATTVAARVPATPPQTHGARVSLSPSCPAGARGHPTPSIEVRLDLSLKVAKRTRPARLGSWWAAAGVGGHTDCAAAIAGLDVPPLSSIEERRRRSISSSSERSAEASRSRCTPCWTCTLEAMAT